MLRTGAQVAIAVWLASAQCQAQQPAAVTTKSADGVRVSVEQSRQIKLGAVENRTFYREHLAFGQIAYNEDALTPVHSPFTGRITRLHAKPGDVVTPGTPLCEIRSPEVVQLYNELIAARHTHAKAQDRATHLKRVLDRQLALLAGKATTQRDIETARSDFETSAAEQHAAQGMLEATRAKFEMLLGRTSAEREGIESAGAIEPVVTIKAPIGGTVIARKVGPGQYVRNETGEALFVIADLSTMWVKMTVSESQAANVHVGYAVQVTLSAFPGRPIVGRVTAVSSLLDPVTRRIVVRSEVPNPDGSLKAEMYATGRVVGGANEISPAVPVGAILREGEIASAWVAPAPLEFKRRELVLGKEQDGYVQVRSGLSAGENVVVSGAIFLDNEWHQ